MEATQIFPQSAFNFLVSLSEKYRPRRIAEFIGLDKPKRIGRKGICTMKSKKTYSTPQAAKKIGVAFITLHRWLRDGKIRSSQAIPLEGRTLWLWTDADIAKGRKVKAALKPGPKPKAGKL